METETGLKKTILKTTAKVDFGCDAIFPPLKFMKNMLEKDFIAYSALPDFEQIKERLFIYDQRKNVVLIAE